MTKASELLQSISTLEEGVEDKIAALRSKTVARGATPAEAESARIKADSLEKKHGISSLQKERTHGSIYHDVFTNLGFTHKSTIGVDNPLHIYTSSVAKKKDIVSGLKSAGFRHKQTNSEPGGFTQHEFTKGGNTVKFNSLKEGGGVLLQTGDGISGHF